RGGGERELGVVADVRVFLDLGEVEQGADGAVLLGLGAAECEQVGGGVAAAAEVGGEAVEEVVGASDGGAGDRDVRVLGLEGGDDLVEEGGPVVVTPPRHLEGDLLVGVEGGASGPRVSAAGAAGQDERPGQRGTEGGDAGSRACLTRHCASFRSWWGAHRVGADRSG